MLTRQTKNSQLNPQNLFSENVPGGHTGGAPPVPIPNTEVKPSKADVTAAARQWESRTLPGYNEGPLVERSAGLFFWQIGVARRKSAGFICGQQLRQGCRLVARG